MKYKYLKILTIFVIVLSLMLTACANDVNQSVKVNNKKDELKIHYIDVGQGDSILVQINGKNMLIDAGPKSSSDKVLKYLNTLGVKKLDVIIATHPHEDHIGSMASVIKNFDLGDFYAPKITSNTKTFENMITALKDKNKKINVAKAGVKINLDNKINCELIAPNSSSYDNINNYSAVLKLTYNNTAFLFTGDAEKVSEKEILQKNFDVKADVLKLGHHGSSTSSSKEFLEKVSPKYAIISCGKNNDYGHPHKETLSEMKKRNIKIYRTDLDGNIILISDGKNISKQP